MKLWTWILLMPCSLSAQESVLTVHFKPVFGETEVKQGMSYAFGDDSLRIESLKFYVSKYGQRADSAELTCVHLFDLEDSQTWALQVQIKEGATDFEFSLGIDSLTNVSGALGGPLDPSAGMYWTWQSGYINFKLEGTFGLCPTRKNTFHFHLGGYAQPFNSIQMIRLPVHNRDELWVNIHLDEWLKAISLGDICTIMSPGNTAMELSALLPSVFRVIK